MKPHPRSLWEVPTRPPPPTDHLSVRTWSGSPLSGLHDSCFQRCGSWAPPPVTISGVWTGGDFNLFTFFKTVFYGVFAAAVTVNISKPSGWIVPVSFSFWSCLTLPVFILLVSTVPCPSLSRCMSVRFVVLGYFLHFHRSPTLVFMGSPSFFVLCCRLISRARPENCLVVIVEKARDIPPTWLQCLYVESTLIYGRKKKKKKKSGTSVWEDLKVKSL